MKKIILIAIALIGSLPTFAQSKYGINWQKYFITGQLSVGGGISNPEASNAYSPDCAYLRIGPDTGGAKGVLLPCVWDVMMIPLPERGVMAFQTKDSTLMLYSGKNWARANGGIGPAGPTGATGPAGPAGDNTLAFQKSLNIIWSSTNPISVITNGSGYDVVVPAGIVVTGSTNPWYLEQPGYTGTIASTQALILDVVTGTWTVAAPTQSNVKDNQGKVVFMQVYSGNMHSALPSVESQLPVIYQGAGKDFTDLHLTGIYTSVNGGNPLTISKKVGDTYTISLSNGYFTSGGQPTNNTYATVSALAETTLNPGQALYLDATDLLNFSVAKSSLLRSNIKDNPRHIPAIINWQGRLWSPMSSVQRFIDEQLAIPTVTHKVVKLGGTIGIDCDYTSIISALAAITDANFKNQYVLDIQPGLYDENADIHPKDYIHLRGQSRDAVIIVGHRATVGESLADFSTINIAGTTPNLTATNLTIIAEASKYCVHYDSYNELPYEVTFQNCIFRSLTSGQPDFGIGIYNNQKLNIINCEFQGDGVLFHGTTSASTNYNSKPFRFNFTGNNLPSVFTFSSYGTYIDDELVTFKDNRIGKLDITFLNSYGLSPVPAFTNFIATGNKIGRVNYDAGANSLFGGPLYVEGLNFKAYNTSGSAILKGYAVIEQPAAIINAYPSNDYPNSRITLYTGSGIFAGFAEQDIAAHGAGFVQHSGTPYARFNIASGIVDFGDQLQLKSTGEVEKRTTGDLIGYAMEQGNTNGLIKIRYNNK